MTSTALELLAPARDAATARAAIEAGADAVYMGAPAFGARAAAANSLEDIRQTVNYAHKFGVKVYITLNTILYDNEIEDAKALCWELYEAGADALIVQDLSLLTMDLPPIDLHASTQTDARTPEKATWLNAAGFSQIVLPREASLREIEAYVKETPSARFEAFVHGALCVSYSGDCQAGYCLGGRSGNRGECPQICRLQFTLADKAGHPILPPDGGPATRHWLSLADMNRLDYLESMAEAGVVSFKIEGRLKSPEYVKNVTAAYSQALDKLVAKGGGKWRRASYVETKLKFEPDPHRTFNRGYTAYFMTPQDRIGLTSWRAPKWIGRPVGSVVKSGKGFIILKTKDTFQNGDGLAYFDKSGTLTGFRANRVDGSKIFLAPGTRPPENGTEVYRNTDTGFETAVGAEDAAERTLPIDIKLHHLSDGRVRAEARDCRGTTVTIATQDYFRDKAKTDPKAHRREELGKLGATPYRLSDLEDNLGDTFIPAKSLAALRREIVNVLDQTWHINNRPQPRKASTLSPQTLKGKEADYHDNIANTRARKWYEEQGAKVQQMAAEVSQLQGEQRIMTTRYCLRRELGACLKTPRATRLPRDLWLDAPVGRLRLAFDCEQCNMQVYTEIKYKKDGKN